MTRVARKIAKSNSAFNVSKNLGCCDLKPIDCTCLSYIPSVSVVLLSKDVIYNGAVFNGSTVVFQCLFMQGNVKV